MELTGTSAGELESKLVQMEDSINYGEKARLQIISSELPSQQDISDFYHNLISEGLYVSKPIVRISQDLVSTEIILTKGSPEWWMIIPIIPTALIVGLIVFGITKIQEIKEALVPLLLIGGVITVAIIAAIAASPRVTEITKEVARRR